MIVSLFFSVSCLGTKKETICSQRTAVLLEVVGPNDALDLLPGRVRLGVTGPMLETEL